MHGRQRVSSRGLFFLLEYLAYLIRLFAVFALAAAGLLPAADCAACHTVESARHAVSAHANSLRAVTHSRFFESLPDAPIGEARGGFLFSFERAGESVKVTAARSQETADALIDWVFGAGRRAETPVAVRGREWIELRISYYTKARKFDLTMGHHPGISGSARQALGIPQTPESIGKCFGCHSSGGLPGEAVFNPGVGCRSCHAGAEEHARGGNPPAAAGMKVCVQCHRSEPEGDPDDPVNVRYQMVRLKRSACFASGRLTCLTCHDPHSDAKAAAADWYRSRCQTCHAGAHANQERAKGDCLGCHMRRVALNARLVFRDHWIRR
jgi:hypothetical protein